MTFAGVPVLDWVLLVVLLGFGVEAYLTTRPTGTKDQDSRRAQVSAPQPSGPSAEDPR